MLSLTVQHDHTTQTLCMRRWLRLRSENHCLAKKRLRQPGAAFHCILIGLLSVPNVLCGMQAELAASLLEEEWPDQKEAAAARAAAREAATPVPERVWALRNVGALPSGGLNHASFTARKRVMPMLHSMDHPLRGRLLHA